MCRRSNSFKTVCGERTVLLGGAHEGDGWTQNREVLQGHEIPLVEGVNSLTPSGRTSQRLSSLSAIHAVFMPYPQERYSIMASPMALAVLKRLVLPRTRSYSTGLGIKPSSTSTEGA